MVLLLLFAAAPPASQADPLPPHAVARFGTGRFRMPGVYAAALSPDGSLVAAIDGRWLRLFDGHTGRRVREVTLNLTPPYGEVEFSPDGRRLGVNAKQFLWSFDVSPGKDSFGRAAGAEFVGRPSFSADGGWVTAAVRTGEVKVWSLRDGERVGEVSVSRHPHPQIVLSPDGKTLAAWGGESRRARGVDLLAVATGKLRHTLAPDADRVAHALFTPDGKSLLPVTTAGGERSVALWEAETGKRQWRRDLWAEDVPVLRFSPDGKQLVAADGRYGRVLDARTGERVAGCVLPRGAEAFDARFTPKGAAVLGRVGSALFVWDVATGRPRRSDGGHTVAVQALAFTRDGNTLVSAGADGVWRWSLSGGRYVEAVSWRGEEGWEARAVTLSPAGRYAAWRLPGGAPTLIDAANGRPAGRIDVPGAVSAVTFSGDESRLGVLTTRLDVRFVVAHARVFDAATGREAWAASAGGRPGTSDLGLTPDGAAAAWAEERRFVRADAGGKVTSGASEPVRGVAFSPCGRWLARAGAAGVEWIDARRGGTLGGWAEAAGALAFSADGRLLAAGGRDAVRVYELGSGRLRLRLGVGDASALAFAPGGRSLAVGFGDSSVLLFDLSGAAAPRDLVRPKEAAWAAMARDDWSPAALLAFPDDAVALLRARLPAAAGAGTTDATVRRWIGELADDDFETREKASRSLAARDRAAPLVEAALKGEKDLEARRRLEKLLDGYRTWPGPGSLRTVRAVEVIEHAGTPAARRLLSEWAAGNPDDPLTVEAKAALGRRR